MATSYAVSPLFRFAQTATLAFSLAGCGARTGLDVPFIDAGMSDVCSYNQGPQCENTIHSIISNDRFFNQPSTARAMLRTEYPTLSAHLIDGVLMGSGGRVITDTDVNDYVRVGDILAVEGTFVETPFLLFYQILADGTIQYANFSFTAFAGIGAYYGIDPVPPNTRAVINAALPNNSCGDLGAILTMAVINNSIYMSDVNGHVTEYPGFPTDVHVSTSNNLCY